MRRLSLIVCLAAAPAWAQDVYFRGSTLATGSSPESVNVVDLDGDGLLDLVSANSVSGTLTIYYGTGVGFAPAESLGVGAGVFEARVADFNVDGLPDLALARIGSFGSGGDVVVRLATTAGVFGPASIVATGDTPVAIEIADLNADTLPDVVAADSGFNGGGDELLVVLNAGGGTFAPVARYAAGDFPADVTVGDFNQDTRPDLAVANAASGTLGVLYGAAGGALAPMIEFPVGSGPRGAAVGDVNGDDRPDVATPNGIGTSDASLLLGEASGLAPERRLEVGSFPTSAALADVNGDDATDLITANRSSADVSVRLGDGVGGFAPALSFPAGVSANFVVAADVNTDGLTDLVVANVGDATLTLLLGTTPDLDASGAVDAFDLAALLAAWGTGAGDLNGDGATDADDLTILLASWG